jgi:thiamine-phosphate pyrophosphorylase
MRKAHPLSRIYRRVMETRGSSLPFPPYIYMADRPPRVPLYDALARLPYGTWTVVRDYGAAGRPDFVRSCLSLCGRMGIPASVAVGSEADFFLLERFRDALYGAHLPRHMHAFASGIKERFPRLCVTASAHDEEEARNLAGLPVDAAIVSPVFPTASHPDAAALGKEGFSVLRRRCGIPCYALGGIAAGDVPGLVQDGAAGVAGVRLFLP